MFSSNKTLQRALVTAVGLLTACGLDETELEYGVAESEVSVQTYTTGACSTSVVLGLSKQIADEISCMNAGGLVRFNAGGNIRISSNAVLPYLDASAKAKLEKVAATRVVQINSGFRTVAQQYLLYRWDQLGRCGIRVAARPGRSNHEGGRALDIANYSSVKSSMSGQGWSANVPGDSVHFEHLASADMRGRDVKAFQRLWNRNNPNDTIEEDGLYGPATEARLKKAPATGFARGASCQQRANEGLEVAMVEGPDKLAPGASARYTFTIDNTGPRAWPATTRIEVANGGTSELYDESSWATPSLVGELGIEVASGTQHVFDIDVTAPTGVLDLTPVSTQLVLTDGATTFGTLQLAATVTPHGDEDTSTEADDAHDLGEDWEEVPEVEGGCNAGGSAGWGALLLPALVLLRRRRR